MRSISEEKLSSRPPNFPIPIMVSSASFSPSGVCISGMPYSAMSSRRVTSQATCRVAAASAGNLGGHLFQGRKSVQVAGGNPQDLRNLEAAQKLGRAPDNRFRRLTWARRAASISASLRRSSIRRSRKSSRKWAGSRQMIFVRKGEEPQMKRSWESRPFFAQTARRSSCGTTALIRSRPFRAMSGAGVESAVMVMARMEAKGKIWARRRRLVAERAP